MTIQHSPSDPPDLALHETASERLMRRRDASWTPDDETAFQAWLAADPVHRSVFDKLSRTWADFAAVPRPALTSDARRRQASAFGSAGSSGVRTRFWDTLLSHRAIAPLAVTACVLLAIGGWYRWDHWQNTPGYTLDVATAPGETRRVDLPDGSHIDLNFSSQLQLRYYPRRREAVLDEGEAFFQIASDPAKPFTVDSGASRVVVVGTRFNVRAAPPRFVVQVLEGRVHLTPDRAHPGRIVDLAAEQGVAVDPATGNWQTVPAPAERVGDWRGGRLVFRRTPLAEVAQELARYLDQPIVVRGDVGLQGLTVSGFADTRAPDAFLNALPDLLPVRVARRPDGGYAIAPR